MDRKIIEQLKSQFDSIMHEDGGVQFWLARELMEPLGYERWENFNNAISTRSEIEYAKAHGKTVEYLEK